MKPKNIVLLGFINEAVKYLDQHIDEDKHDYKLSKLKNIDLVSLEDELSKNLASSLGTMQNTMTSLLNAGNEAFEEFLDNHSDAESAFVSDLNNIFDVNLDGNQKSSKEELEDLLSFYNLDKKVDDAASDYERKKLGTYLSNNANDEFLKEIAKAASQTKNNTETEETRNDANPELDHLFNEIIDHENGDNEDNTEQVEETESNDLVKEVSAEEEIPTSESIEKVEAPEKEKVEEVAKTNVPESNATDEYVGSLIEDLKVQLAKEDKVIDEEEEKRKAVYEKVSSSYPYLQQSFVKSVYDMKDSINDEYREGVDVVILHRIIFKEVDELRQYAEVVINHGYEINVDEDKLIVDCIKQFTNSKGKIVSNIFAIANQAAKLNGAYDGYRVILASELAEE